MESDQLILEALWMNTSSGGWKPSWEKEELKGTEKKLKEQKVSKQSCFRYDKKKLKRSNKNWKLVWFYSVLVGNI